MDLFNGESHYPDMSDGYRLYLERCRNTDERVILTEKQYNNVIRMFCRSLAGDIESNGMVDLPCGMGTIAAVRISRTPKYIKSERRYAYRSVDWDRTRADGRIVISDEPYAFGIAYMAKHMSRVSNSRCFGIRANKALFKRMKSRYKEGSLGFQLVDMNNYVI